jgi:hypothetical protein
MKETNKAKVKKETHMSFCGLGLCSQRKVTASKEIHGNQKLRKYIPIQKLS